MLTHSDVIFGVTLYGSLIFAFLLIYLIVRMTGPGFKIGTAEFVDQLRAGDAVVVLMLKTGKRWGLYPKKPTSRLGNSDWTVRPATGGEIDRYERYQIWLKGLQS